MNDTICKLEVYVFPLDNALEQVVNELPEEEQE
jgi:hypothetical protein